MSLIRVTTSVEVQAEHTFTVGIDEAPTDATGDVTWVYKRLDGTQVATGVAVHGQTGQYTIALPASATVDTLTLDWTGTVAGVAVTVRDWVEVVGGHYFGVREARVANPGLTDESAYPADVLARARIEVEQEFEEIAGLAFYPRFARVVLSGSGSQWLGIPQRKPHREIRAIRAVSVAGVAWSPADVAAVSWTDAGYLVRAGGAVWPAGTRNVIVEYEHGMDMPPERVASVGRLRLRALAGLTYSQIPDRAVSFVATDGGTYRVSTPDGDRTGMVEVDGVLAKYRRKPRPVFA